MSPRIKGVTDALYEGTPERLGLAEVLTVRSTGQININTTGPLVLRALGFSEAEISDVMLARRDAIFVSVPGRYAGRGLVATTIEAEGIIDGQVRARIIAIVQRRTDTAPSSVAILEWSGVR